MPEIQGQQASRVYTALPPTGATGSTALQVAELMFGEESGSQIQLLRRKLLVPIVP